MSNTSILDGEDPHELELSFDESCSRLGSWGPCESGDFVICDEPGDEGNGEGLFTISSASETEMGSVWKVSSSELEVKERSPSLRSVNEARKTSSRTSRRVSVAVPSGSRRQSIFVHSSPSQFPDILKARKSAFASIFVKASANTGEDSFLTRRLAESESFLDSLVGTYDPMDRFRSRTLSDTERKHEIKESICSALEKGGTRRPSSVSSPSDWDVYPISHSTLFSVLLREQIHQTRHVSKIEDRLAIGPQLSFKESHRWPTGSTWTGHWDTLGMAGTGTYVMPHGVVYIGNMVDGMFHDDDATLVYPSGFKVTHCRFEKGKLLDRQFQFPDKLSHEEENWDYCQFPDRRFWSEVREGLKPVKVAQKTQTDQSRRIPSKSYDTSDGFYNPKTKMLTSPRGELLRVPTNDEEKWIMRHCRKGFHENVGFRPDLFENFYDHDTEFINLVREEQEKYERGEITYENLQQFYADRELLPCFSNYQKTRTTSQIALEEYFSTLPSPKPLVRRQSEKPFEGHKIPHEVLLTVTDVQNGSPLGERKSRSAIKFEENNKLNKISMMGTDSEITGNTASKIKFDEGGGAADLTRSKSASRLVPARSADSKSILKTLLFTMPGDEVEEKRTGWNEEVIEDDEPCALTKEEEEELDRSRKRLVMAQPVPNPPFKPRNEVERCVRALEELYDSIPDREEYCDSDLTQTGDLTKLSQDKYNTLKYWGKRIITLDFPEPETDCPQI